jgi:hypothetical protein
MCQVCPGPVQAVEVGESRYRDAEIRGRLIAPLLAQVGAAAPDNLHRREKAVGVKAGRERDHVDFVTASGYVDHRVLVDRCDLLRDELDVGALERREPAAVVLQFAPPGSRAPPSREACVVAT